MADDKRQDPLDDGKIDVVDCQETSYHEQFVDPESSLEVVTSVSTSTSGSADDSRQNDGQGSTSGVADRLADILVENGDGDLLLQHSDRENNFLQWLQALDMQVMGACRADERLKPLLKGNGGPAEDRLLAHLSQHFEAAEVGLLARCLCIPLVSIRVGKVIKRGAMLCPTSVRGNLTLTLLPSSDLRISFVGDGGNIERLATLSSISESAVVVVEDIAEDNSGRSFLVRIDHDVLYFWCSEKSKLLGVELLSKMKDLLKRKPTLAELTGISESRLERFATHLRAYLVGSSGSKTTTAASTILDRRPRAELGLNSQSKSRSVKSLRAHHTGSQAVKICQGSLSPRSSSFKEGVAKSFSSLRNVSRDKLRRRGDIHLPAASSLSAAALTGEAPLNYPEKGKHAEDLAVSSALPLSFLEFESLGKSAVPLSFFEFESLGKSAVLPMLAATSQHSSIGALFSPHYCWCPPCTSSAASFSQLPMPSVEPLSLPPLSSLLPPARPSNLLSQTPPFDLASLPPLDLPGLLPDPLVQLPFSNQSSQQFPTFTPLMCDPIVHVPVIDICSSGQGYLVSAGPALATSISPLHPNMVGPLITEAESMVENSARETLRLLIGGSSSSNPPLMNSLPAVLNEDKQAMVVTGSRGLYTGSKDVDAIAKGIAAVGFAVPLPESSMSSKIQVCSSSVAVVDFQKSSGMTGVSCLDVQGCTSSGAEEAKD